MRTRILNKARAAVAFFKRHGHAIGKTLLVLLLAVIAALPAVVDNTVIGYLPVCMVVFSILMNFVYLQFLCRAVAFTEKATLRNCNRGESVDIGIEVANRSWLLASRIDAELFISNLTGGVDTSFSQRISLLPKESRDLEIAARFDHIGRYKAGLRSLVVYDLFGIFKRELFVDTVKEIEVAPRLADIKRLDVTQQAVTESTASTQTVINDGFDYIGMRDYALGDPMKSIHWKASARYEDLMTRLYEHQINPVVCVVIDPTTRWADEERMMCMYDAVVEAALSIASYAQDSGIECVVVVADKDGEVHDFLPRKPWGYTDVLDALPRLYAPGSESLASAALHQTVYGLYGSSNIIVCSANPEEELVSEMIATRVTGKRVSLLFARPGDLKRAEEDSLMRRLSRLSAAQIPYLAYADAREIGEV